MDTVTTDRLVLRRFTEADAPALLSMMSDAQVNRFLPYFPHVCVEDTRSYLEQNFLRWYRAQTPVDAVRMGCRSICIVRFVVSAGMTRRVRCSGS